MKPKTSINVVTWLFQSDFIIVVTICFILFFIAISDAQIKINHNDQWDSTALQFGVKFHDKSVHGARGFVNVYIFEFILPKKMDKYSELFSITFSALWEVKDGLTHSAEYKDFYAEVGGIAFAHLYKRLPKDARVFGAPFIAWGFYKLIKVK